MKSLYKNIKESVLDDSETIFKRSSKELPMMEWMDKYKGYNFKQGRDFTIESEGNDPIISIKNGKFIDLSGSTNLDMVHIKWPDNIEYLHLLHDDYLTQQWFADNFKDKNINTIEISCLLYLPELNLNFINLGDANIFKLRINYDHTKTKIIIPK